MPRYMYFFYKDATFNCYDLVYDITACKYSYFIVCFLSFFDQVNFEVTGGKISQIYSK